MRLSSPVYKFKIFLKQANWLGYILIRVFSVQPNSLAPQYTLVLPVLPLIPKIKACSYVEQAFIRVSCTICQERLLFTV